MPTKQESYYDILTQAINDFATNGYDSPERLAFWQKKLRDAAEQLSTSASKMEEMLRDAMSAVYRRQIEQGSIAQYHGGIGRFTIEKLRPQLRAELTRRILASADLIRLNRKQAIEKTLQRFSGWATSVPKGGSKAVAKVEEKSDVRKPLAQLKFEERRVLIDQSHKLFSNLNNIIATDGGAIAAEWHSNWKQRGYNFRAEHKERDGEVYLIRDSWAAKQGLVKPRKAGFSDEITQPGEEPFCRCRFRYIYNLGSLPKDMLTKKGSEALKVAKKEVKDALNS